MILYRFCAYLDKITKLLFSYSSGTRNRIVQFFESYGFFCFCTELLKQSTMQAKFKQFLRNAAIGRKICVIFCKYFGNIFFIVNDIREQFRRELAFLPDRRAFFR